MGDQFILPDYQYCLNDLLMGVFKTMGEAIVVANEDGKIIMINHHVQEIWGYEPEQLLGQDLTILMPDSFHSQHRHGMQRYIETGKKKVLGQRLELEATRSNGNNFPIQLYLAETRVENHRLFTAAIRDISEIVNTRNDLEKARQELLQTNNLINAKNVTLTEEVRLDPLTRVLNHVALKQQLQKEMERLSRSPHPFSILFLDIDNFKLLNDDFGHLFGDRCLLELSCLINDELIRSIDTVGRYGGEEFVIVMPDVDVEGAIAAGKRLCEAIEAYNWSRRPVTVTIGAATAHKPTPIETLIGQADKAMYYGKQQGKNQSNHWQQIEGLSAASD